MKNRSVLYGSFSTFHEANKKYHEVMANTDYQYYVRQRGKFFYVERGEKIH